MSSMLAFTHFFCKRPLLNSLGMLYLSQCSFPKDHCWFPENLRATVSAGVFDLAPRVITGLQYPSCRLLAAALFPVLPCSPAAMLLLLSCPAELAVCWGVLGNVLYALGMTVVWLLMNPMLDCSQEARRRQVPCGSVLGRCLWGHCTALPQVECLVLCLWVGLATMLDFLRTGPCRKGAGSPLFFTALQSRFNTLAMVHAVEATVLKELEIVVLKLALQHLMFHRVSPCLHEKEWILLTDQFYRSVLAVCTAALSHVITSSLFQQWPVSTGSKIALHETLGIIKTFNCPNK